MRQILQVGRLWASWTSPSNRPITAVTLLVGMSRLVGVTVSPMSRVALSALTIERWAVERAVAVAGAKAPVAGESVCGGVRLDLLVHLLNGGFHVSGARGVEHGALQGMLGSRGAQATLGVHAEGTCHERGKAGIFEMSIDIATAQLNVGADQANARLTLFIHARGIDGKHAAHATGLNVKFQTLDHKLNTS